MAEDDGDLNNDHQSLVFSPAVAGANQLLVVNAAVFAAGQDVYVGGLGLGQAAASSPEVKRITAVNTATRTLTLGSGLQFGHNTNEIVATPDILASSTLSAGTAAGAGSVSVASAAGFAVGQSIALGAAGAREAVTITGISGTTLNVTPVTAFAHAGGDAVNASFAFNGVADGADAYPSFVQTSLDPDGPGPMASVTPRARYFGVAFVANTLIVTLQFVIFDLGQLTAFPNLGWANANWGYASTTFLQDPVAPPSNSAISDFCNFTSNTHFTGRAGDNLCTPIDADPAKVDCYGFGAGFTLRFGVRNGCTQLRDPVSAGGTSIVVQNKEQLAVGNTISIGATGVPPTGGESKVIATKTDIAGTTETTLTFAGGLLSGYPAGAQVVRTAPARTTIDECGYVRQTNPATAGSVRYYQYAVSQRDADNDGIVTGGVGFGGENALDVCPLDPNPTWNPRAPNSSANDDTDVDGIPNECDPGATTCSDPQDQDCDGWKNRIDQCPTVVNGNFTSNLSANAAAGAGSVTVVSTTGFHTGDIIDVSQADISTTPPQIFDDPGRTVTSIVGNVISFTPNLVDAFTTGGGSRPQPAVVTQVSHASNTNQFDRDIPVGSAVPDGGPASDSISPECDPHPTAIDGHYHATAASYSICIGVPAAPMVDDCTGADEDADGISNAADTCRAGKNGPLSNGPPANFAQSLRDVNNDGFSDISDISTVGGKFGKNGGIFNAPAGYEGRLDLNYDNTIDISDITLLGATFGKRCGPALIDP